MNFKRVCSLLIACVMVIGSLVGCGQAPDTPTAEPTSGTVAPTSGTEGTEADPTQAQGIQHPITTEPITFEILATNNSINKDVEGEAYYCFKWLEHRMAELGYNVTLNVTNDAHIDEKISMLLNGDNLPDLVFGYQLSAANAVLYGEESGMILDWTEYLDEYMPNVKQILEDNPIARLESTCTDGAIYGLPNIVPRTYFSTYVDWANSVNLFVNQAWMDECNLEMPTTIEEFINMLRAFKNEIKLENGEEVIPYVGSLGQLEQFIWAGLGYYGAAVNRSGLTIAIKDGEICVPAYSEDYETYLEIMHTLFSEELIYADYYTADSTTIKGLYAQGVVGVMGAMYMTDDFANIDQIVTLKPIAIGDNEEVFFTLNYPYQINKCWASADVEHPEVLAIMLNELWSIEGRMIYEYGPYKGTDPLNLLGGWYLDENYNFTCDLVENGTYANWVNYICDEVRISESVVPQVGVYDYIKEVSGVDVEIFKDVVTDPISGEEYETVLFNYGDTTFDPAYMNTNRYSRWLNSQAWKGHTTTVKLGTVYRTADEALHISELGTLLADYAAKETVKFITGEKSFSEIPDFMKELEKIGIQEYIDLSKEDYAPFMEMIFGK